MVDLYLEGNNLLVIRLFSTPRDRLLGTSLPLLHNTRAGQAFITTKNPQWGCTAMHPTSSEAWISRVLGSLDSAAVCLDQVF